jgi:transposase
MKLPEVDISDTVNKTRVMLDKQTNLSPEFRALISLILLIVESLLPRLIKANSKNSSLPPSQDPNRLKQSKKSGKKPGGQIGRAGTQLKQYDEVDEVVTIAVDRSSLSKDRKYSYSRTIKRQIVDVKISQHVTEYQLEVLVDEFGKEYVATAPDGVTRPIQYGNSIKSLSTYMSQYQMIPYLRIENFFRDKVGIPISQGSIFNFNKEAYDKLASFEEIVREALQQSRFLHVDETGVNIDGKRHWLHNASNDKWTLLFPHEKRGKEAMDEMNILPHSLCNAHHDRELNAIIESEPDHKWPIMMKDFLLQMNDKVNESGNYLSRKEYRRYRQRYRNILQQGEIESPPPRKDPKNPKKGRIKKSKERNLLERFVNFEKDVLRFILVEYVPFTNNQGERDLRMAKVQQKISGCFKTIITAKIHARIRSYILSEQKQGKSAAQAIDQIFSNHHAVRGI